MENKESRGSFTGTIGFVLAAAGSAVGLGNIWRFPYLAAKDGGGIFLVMYILLALTFGFTLLTTEIAIGRKTKQSPLTAYKQLSKKWGFLGVIACVIPMIILPYYCAIGGWVLKYFISFLSSSGAAAAATDGFFTGFITSQVEPIVLMVVFMTVTATVIFLGVNKGIESSSKILMPLLILLVVGIAVFSVTINYTDAEGVTRTGLEGLKIYIVPNFEGMTVKGFFTVLLDAMGQMFYSLSVAMGIMIAYGSYVKDEVNVMKSVNHIEIFDTAIALLSGLMIVPAVFIFSGEEGLKSSGVGLMFSTLPRVFADMPFGGLIGLIFFVLVFFAAITSSISILEAIVSNILDKFNWDRRKASFGVAIMAFVLGIPSALGFGALSHVTPLGMDFLTFFDYISNSVFMPIVALATCIMFGWVVGTKTIEDEVTKNGENFGRKKVFRVMIKYVAPVCLVVILIFYSLAQFGFISY